MDFDANDVSFGLPKDEAIRVCKSRFKNHLAFIQVQIMEPKVMNIVKDIKISFYDQLGVIGQYLSLFFLRILKILLPVTRRT